MQAWLGIAHKSKSLFLDSRQHHCIIIYCIKIKKEGRLHLMKRIILFCSLLILSGCGSSEAETFLSRFLDSVYAEKKATPFFSRMSPAMVKEVRYKWLDIYSAKERLSEKYVSHSITGVKSQKKGDRKFLYGYIKQTPRRGRKSYRTFLAKYYRKKVTGSKEGIWILYDLIIKKGKKRSTARKMLKLTEPSKKAIRVLANLKKEVNIIVFDRQRNSLSTHLLKELAVHSKGKIKLEYLNPYIERGSASTFNINSPGYIVVRCGKNNFKIKMSELLFRRGQAAFFQGERIVMTAIRRVCGRSSEILYLTGHGERPVTAGKEEHFSKAIAELKLSGFTITLAPRLNKKNLENRPIVFLAGPRFNPGFNEIKLLKEHHKNGGRTVLLVEKPVPVTLSGIIHGLGIRLLLHTIVDPTTKDFIKGPSCFESRIPYTPITGAYTSRETFKVIINGAAGMMINTNVKTAARPFSFLTTTTNGWAEASYEEDKPDDIQFTPGYDIKGPIALAYAVAKVEKKGKILLFGDCDFISDSLFTSKISNWIFFLNSMGWLTDRDMLTLPIRKFNYRRLVRFL